MSHKLAHQWFGDLLTAGTGARSGSTNPSPFSSKALWNEHDKGKDDYLYEMYGNRQAIFRRGTRAIAGPL